MKSNRVWLLFLVLLAAVLGSQPQPALAYYPPLTQVQAWKDTDGVTVRFKVYDPRLDKWQESSWTGGAGVTKVDALATQDGVAVWMFEKTAAGGGVKGIVMAVYDPARGIWQVFKSEAASDATHWVWFSDLTTRGGVVAVFMNDTTLATPNYPYCDFNLTILYFTYDPVAGAWQEGHDFPYAQPLDCNNPYPDITTHLLVQDGVVAYWVQPLKPGLAYGYGIFDPSRNAWKTETAKTGTNVTGMTGAIIDATCFFQFTGTTKFFPEWAGYDYTDGTWHSGTVTPLTLPQWTKVLSRFAAQPISGTAPLWVWFTDLSIGANKWAWKFGDGGTSSDRSPYHVYNQAGFYVAGQTATGNHGSNQSTQKIRVMGKSKGKPFLDLLLDK